MKTARFAKVVKASGAPETYLLWLPPAKDKIFQRGLKEHRVMTLHQELRGGKKDYGRVGFHEEPNAQFIIFPKSLRRFEDRRIVGIDYDLFAKNSRSSSTPKVVSRERKIVPLKSKRQAAPDRVANQAANVFKFPGPNPPPDVAPAEASDRESARKPIRRGQGQRSKKAKPPKLSLPVDETQPERARAAVDPRFVSEIKNAMKEIRSGKSVMAYERLKTLLAEAKNVAGLGEAGPG